MLGERGYMSIAEGASSGIPAKYSLWGVSCAEKGMGARFLPGTRPRIIQVQLPKRNTVYCTIKYLAAFAESPF